MPKDDVPPVPPLIRDILNSIYHFARSDDLGVVSALTVDTRSPRFVLAGRVVQPDGTEMMVPLGYLATGINSQIEQPGERGFTVTVTPDPDAGPPPLDDFTATMIAEGIAGADEDLTLRAWQHLEDTGLGYKLQGHFGRRLRDLIAAGSIRPRKGD